MSVTYANTLKTSRMSAIITAIGSTGILEIGTTGMSTILVRFSLDASVGTVSGSVLTFSGMPKTATTLATGTAATARIRTAVGGTDIVTGLTVGTSGTDVIINSTSITSGQTASLNSATITHA